MRYYSFIMKTSSEEIAQNTKIRLREYNYDCTLGAVNDFIQQTKQKQDSCFFAYREEEGKISAAFSFNEKTDSLQSAFELLTETLKENFSIKKIVQEPVEITTKDFYDYLYEARRRNYTHQAGNIKETANLLIYDNYVNYKYDGHSFYAFDFCEKIIPDDEVCKLEIYDSGLLDEIKNIETHTNSSEIIGNAAHYVISARSMEAACDITQNLTKALLKANRISGRRMSVIRSINPESLGQRNNYLEDIIENNYGGVIVLDLTERLTKRPANYVEMSKYILNLLKKYRNKCLFVFTYNIDNPGFSYQILPELYKYVNPVMIREGKATRKGAITYLKNLIRESEYSKYAGQAAEFLKQYPGSEFTQTDVIMAYEQFEPWCLSKNILGTQYASPDEFMTERDANAKSPYDELQKLIGLDIVKKQIDDIIANFIVEKERKKKLGKAYATSCMHMIFAGNPGTAKTTVARHLAAIAKEKGILKSGAFVVYGGMDLKNYETIRQAFEEARGGVLFVDEAYAMDSYSAATVFIQELENHREDVIAILAGYGGEMKDFLKLNDGMKSRIPYWIEFPDYSEDELTEIFKLMLEEKHFTATDDAVLEARNILSRVRFNDNFGNGRYVRNLVERAIKNQSVRLLSEKKDADKITKKELFSLEKEDIRDLEDSLKKERPKGSAMTELDEMIGLSEVKDLIHKAVANFKMKKLFMERGISKERPSYHMVFTGNPGTAKTTVARLFAEILKDERVLQTGNFVEVGRADLVGMFVGQTAQIVKYKFKQARGGVLFIDEAYALCDNVSGSYGDEAINTIVQEMENHRDDVIVIFAGYPGPMQEFLERNPGMNSRIAFKVGFEDYTADELCGITKLMVSRKQLEITDAALEILRDIYEDARNEEDYGNGRFVRKMIESAEMNLSMRLSETDPSEITNRMLTTIEADDIPSFSPKKKTGTIRVGF